MNGRKEALDLILSILEHIMEDGSLCLARLCHGFIRCITEDPEDSKRRSMSCEEHPGGEPGRALM